ncbi:MAG: tetratricopeptide repeat protein [Bacteroidota bacterium]
MQAQIDLVDDPGAVLERLFEEREAHLQDSSMDRSDWTLKALQLGLWEEAVSQLEAQPEDTTLLEARFRYLILNNAFREAEKLLETKLKTSPVDRLARLLRSELEIQAWELKRAERTCLDLLNEEDKDQAVVAQLGRIYMLQRNYPKALALAEQLIGWDSKNPAAYLLAAEVQFWLRNGKKAEEYLQTCLKLDPFNPNARFYYGYAIWRRIDATQLDDMAAHWEIALAVDPLHYLTHWHWGNGHTHLTFADYVDPDEDEIRLALALADSLIAENQIDSAIQICLDLEGVYFASVLPSMTRASAFYMDYSRPMETRMDSAQKIFQAVLRKKPHYGPAHNGLAAVIKQKRFPYLTSYDSLQTVIENTVIADPGNFIEVFPDMDYYPGDRVKKMVWNQLYTSVVYFPFLARQKREFVIPSLHTDLATAMKTPYFRRATTFDNRQWMDIRGVGSGATAIEYVERGAHLERNVTLHEYVHLFHGNVFSDAENRRVRALYYHAMENDLTLDYYSANNELEYLAQTYTAYFLPVKVHPLNHKSTNTRSELKRKDPQLYAFLDSLIGRQQAYLDGDSSALAANWAQVYLNLANKEEERFAQRAYLDTALMWDSTYLPALIAYAETTAKARQFRIAQQWLDKAKIFNPDYAPIYVAQANLRRQQWEIQQLETEGVVEEISLLYEKALRLEKDYSVRARFNHEYWTFMRNMGYLQEAVAIAESYAASAPTISTYLRDRKADAKAFAWEIKGQLGYLEGAREFFTKLIAQKPQAYHYRAGYAQVLLANEQFEEVIQLLGEAQRILEAAGTPRTDFMGMIAMAQLALEDQEAALSTLEAITEGSLAEKGDPYLWVELTLALKGPVEARKKFLSVRFPGNPYDQSRYYQYKGMLLATEGDKLSAQEAYKLALEANVYNLEARLGLLGLISESGEKRQIRRIATRATVLPIPPGPGRSAQFQAFLRQ